MKAEYKFKSVDWSNSLVEYAEEKFEKLKKFEMKPLKTHMTFSKDKHIMHVICYVHSGEGIYQAQAHAEDFYDAVDMAFSKIKKQLLKKKSKIQNHHHFSHSKEGKLSRTTEEMDVMPIYGLKKAG